MTLSRRAIFGGFGARSASPIAALVAARGREALVAELGPLAGEASVIAPPQGDEIRISSNENPFGPSDHALAAVREAFNEAGRYPINTQPSMRDLTHALAEKHGTDPGNIVLGAGSGELLKNSAHAYTGKDKHLVAASPTYLLSLRVSRYLRADVKAIPVDSAGMLDLDAMASAARGAGLIFSCNPNNPTGTVHSGSDVREFVATVRRTSPETVIHFDEAYHEYVTHPDYESALELALDTPNVFVTRTFSKCFGMAGLRIGYGVGHSETMRNLSRYSLTLNTNTPGVAAAYAALQERDFVARERERNSAAKKVTIDFFEGAGFPVMDSHTNFFFVDIGRPAADMRAACAKKNVRIGRDFPPMEKTHARISIGTMEEMQQAIPVFAEALGVATNGGGGRA